MHGNNGKKSAIAVDFHWMPCPACFLPHPVTAFAGYAPLPAPALCHVHTQFSAWKKYLPARWHFFLIFGELAQEMPNLCRCRVCHGIACLLSGDPARLPCTICWFCSRKERQTAGWPNFLGNRNSAQECWKIVCSAVTINIFRFFSREFRKVCFCWNILYVSA